MRIIVFDTPRYMWLTTESWVALFLTVLILWNTRIHVCATDGDNIVTDIELPADNTLDFESILQIPDFDLNNSYVRFGKCFDYI